jgi:hypothetical protein
MSGLSPQAVTQTSEDQDIAAIQALVDAAIALVALNDLSDVDTTGVADGDVLVYDLASNSWLPQAPTGGGGGGLLPVDTQTATDTVSILSNVTDAGFDSYHYFGATISGPVTQVSHELNAYYEDAGSSVTASSSTFANVANDFGGDVGHNMQFSSDTMFVEQIQTLTAIGQSIRTLTAADLSNTVNIYEVLDGPNNTVSTRFITTDGAQIEFYNEGSVVGIRTVDASEFKIESDAPVFTFNVAADAGDILIASLANTFTKLGIGTEGQVLTVTSGLPAWEDATGGGGGPGATELDDLTDVDLTGLADNDILQYDLASGLWKPVAAPTGGGGTGDGVLARNILVADLTVPAGVSYIVAGYLDDAGFDIDAEGEVMVL